VVVGTGCKAVVGGGMDGSGNVDDDGVGEGEGEDEDEDEDEGEDVDEVEGEDEDEDEDGVFDVESEYDVDGSSNEVEFGDVGDTGAELRSDESGVIVIIGISTDSELSDERYKGVFVPETSGRLLCRAR
jgi:hypothetical protein